MLAAVGAQLEDAETRRVKLEQDLAVRVDSVRRKADTALAAQVEVLKAQAAETAQQRDAEVRARARADVARAEERLAEVEQTLTAIRKEADLAHAEVERLQAERTDQRERSRREARGQHERQLADVKVRFSAMKDAEVNTKATLAEQRAMTRRGMAEITAPSFWLDSLEH